MAAYCDGISWYVDIFFAGKTNFYLVLYATDGAISLILKSDGLYRSWIEGTDSISFFSPALDRLLFSFSSCS